ncbi:MAG: hypothetical protein IPJ95_07025 [Gemmatimonadetes bacterium]|nr:hypothetical protein [Gemmatimonadota bacterium]MBK7785082.1 hypothetical protein [Gemmatimonadota bacterium]MBK7923374.1 hypothetical protein [Gemmatimonadota bacterium]MBK9066834.1 hypothetical protein [Gemmatimonadota bacterium]
MRAFTLCCTLALLAGCAKPEQQAAADTTAALGAGAPATISLASVAGRWNSEVKLAGTGQAVLTMEITATADTSGWAFTFPGKPPVPVRVIAVDGDSIVTEAGPYDSALRPGTMVTTRSVMRLVGDKLVGTAAAHYDGTPADSVVQLSTEATRAQ